MASTLLLFDIDATLLWTGGAGRTALKAAIDAVYGEKAASFLDQIEPAGRTMREIIEDVLGKAQVPQSVFVSEFDRFDRLMNDILESSIESGQFEVEQCPGAGDLLAACVANEDFLVGLLTGNPPTSAMIKLKAADYDASVFRVCAFGDESPVRADLVHIARRRAQKLVGDSFPGTRTILIGDSIRDVLCAHQSDAACIGVATGRSSSDALRAQQAHAVFDDLTDTDAVLCAIKTLAEQVMHC